MVDVLVALQILAYGETGDILFLGLLPVCDVICKENNAREGLLRLAADWRARHGKVRIEPSGCSTNTYKAKLTLHKRVEECSRCYQPLSLRSFGVSSSSRTTAVSLGYFNLTYLM